jgi:hypothetical protein
MYKSDQNTWIGIKWFMFFNSKLIDGIFRTLHESDTGGSAIIQCSMFDVQKSLPLYIEV